MNTCTRYTNGRDSMAAASALTTKRTFHHYKHLFLASLLLFYSSRAASVSASASSAFLTQIARIITKKHACPKLGNHRQYCQHHRHHHHNHQERYHLLYQTSSDSIHSSNKQTQTTCTATATATDTDANTDANTNTTAATNTTAPCYCCCEGEVVGHTGRIGSFLLRANNANFVPVPRRDSRPGTLSPIGTPIYVSVPATQVISVINATIPHRRQDLVFVTNGIPSDFMKHFVGHDGDGNDNDNGNNNNGNNNVEKDKDENMTMTTSVPHFGVLKVGQDPISNKLLSPPTIIHGKHAKRLQTLLESHGITSKVVSSTMDIDAAAIRKLIWVSSMWLLCHDTTTKSSSSSSLSSSPSPIDVTQVHQLKQHELFQLVQHELYPAALALLERYHNISHADAINVMGTVGEVMKYLESYSFSMPGACPNKKLAIDEIGQRNSILLSTSIAQPRHKALIERVIK